MIAIVGAVASAALGGQIAYRRALKHQATEANALLVQRADVLDRYLDRYRIMPAVLAFDPQLRATLENPGDAALRQRADQRLLQLNFSSRTSTLTLIDRHGLALAASNWQDPQSNVGHLYDYRPYFNRAIVTGDGEFYAIGATTGVPGYYIARAIYDDAGVAIGVVAVKVVLEDIQSNWKEVGQTILLSDANDVVFLASEPSWRYRVLAAPSDRQKADLERTHQYLAQSLLPVDLRTTKDLGTNASLVDVRVPASGNDLLWQSIRLPREGWQLHVLENTSASRHAAWIATAISAGAWLLLVALATVIWQRHRITSIKLRGERELQHLIQHHAIALRTAQDGVLQAAREAALGYGHSLEHLPQGVSVIDTHLNLVAWNRRYAEMFGYPSGFLSVGRPIADLIRHNAKRGFLGGDGGEAAVQRRLAYLRNGQPHLHERISPGGTVIEIRGNPLPEGGFVTSYVDITTYKQTARELRSMIDSLELRIRQRTRDLQIAKSEAERANRSKSRFVAAAVHDLLQPLNAARLYLPALRKHVDADGDALAGHVNEALATQEGILSSLLDISRLESGSFEVHIASLPLGSLFDSLVAQFRPFAASRQIDLRMVRTGAVIQSDEVLLRRVLQNFLSNALKFTAPGGRVLLGCRRTAENVRIEIWDTGPGIPENKHEAIFEEFQRLDKGPEQDHGGPPSPHGAGLGLAIVRHIARLLGHRVALRSWPHHGSVFSIDVARGRACDIVAPQAADESEAMFRGRTIWIVDDDPHSLRAAHTLLQAWGCKVLELGRFEEAMTVGRQSSPPDLLLLDYRLGEANGFDLGERLGEIWATLPPVILVSADAYSNLRTRCRELGWGYLPKPLRPAALRALMMRMLELPAAMTAAGLDTEDR